MQKGSGMLKTIGMILILMASGTVGFGMARTVRRQQVQTVVLIDALLRLRHELQYRLTPLPDAFAVLGEMPNREVAAFFSAMSTRLQSGRTCTVGYACRRAMAQTGGLQLTAGTRSALLALFDALGRKPADAGAGAGSAARRGKDDPVRQPRPMQNIYQPRGLHRACHCGDTGVIWTLT